MRTTESIDKSFRPGPCSEPDPKTSKPDSLPNTKHLVVRVTTDHNQLASLVDPWRTLAQSSCEPNAYQLPELHLAAKRHISHDLAPEYVQIWSEPPDATPILCGLFPLYRRVQYRSKRTIGASIWLPTYVGLGTPLVHKKGTAEIIDCFYQWLQQSGVHTFCWPFIHSQGPFYKALIRCHHSRSFATLITRQFARKTFRPDRNFDSFMQRAMSHRRRRHARRLHRRLEEQGQVTVESMEDPEQIDPWLADYMRIESSSWKGRARNALANSDDHPKYCRDAIYQMALGSKLHFLALAIDGKRIAMLCCFHDQGQSQAFLITYDESWEKYSPGLLLLVEYSKQLHDSDIQICDSCSDDNRSICEFVWDCDRIIQTVWSSTGSIRGVWMIGLLTGISAAERIVVRRVKSVYRKWKFRKSKPGWNS